MVNTKQSARDAVANQNGPANFLDTTAAEACVMGIITGFLPISLRLAIWPVPITHTLWREASRVTHAAACGWVAKMLRNAAGWPTVHNPAAFSLLQW